MKSILPVLGLGLLASAASVLGGCAIGAQEEVSSKESSASTQQADSSDYLQTFDEYFQSIIFAPNASLHIDWVILHVTINGTRTYNVKMPSTGTSAAAGPSYEIEELPVVAGDAVDYSFTYSVNGLAHDTPQFHYTLAASFSPPVFHTEVSNGAIRAIAAKPLAWADAHYRINGGAQQNVRMSAQGTTPVALNAGDSLEYFVTYSTGVAVFDTASSKSTSGPVNLVVDAPADSTTGLCAPNGNSRGQCNLRAAFAAAQLASGPATITLNVDSTIDGGVINVDSGKITVSGLHAINGNGTARFLNVAAGATLTLRDLSISNFRAYDQAAAILNNGSVDLEGVTVASNITLCEETGAMTAFATCDAGAIASTGTLTLGGGTTFSNNSVTANASTAAFTNASAGGGAIASSGTLNIVGAVTFNGNAANANANSGFHPAPIGGASASSSGGAIANSGTLTVTAPAGSCVFSKNAANANASTVNGTATQSSRGGAIENTGTLHIPDGACTFVKNVAVTAADIDG